MPIENPTKEQISDYLGKINWRLTKPNQSMEYYYFVNNKSVYVGMTLLFPDTDARLEFEGGHGKTTGRKPNFYFYLKDCVMELLDDNCVSFRGKNDKSIFVLLQNFDK